MPATVIYEYIIISESVFVKFVSRTHTLNTENAALTEKAKHITAVRLAHALISNGGSS